MKNNIFKILAAVLFVAVSIIWVLSAALPEQFGMNIAWIIAIYAFSFGLLFIVKAIVAKGEMMQVRRFDIVFGIILIVAGVCALIGTFFTSVKIVLPVIALVISAGVLVSTLFVRGEKWDKGDNEKPGYKNYYERKAEAEAAEKAVEEKHEEIKEENKEEK